MDEELDDRFELLRHAAVGGMGIVYEAREKATGARVALKVLQTSAREDVLRFEREAAILAQLEHPGIVRYVAHGVSQRAAPYLAMDWVDGETLDARLSRTGLRSPRAVELARRVADGARIRARARRSCIATSSRRTSSSPGGELSRVTLLDFGVARLDERSAA